MFKTIRRIRSHFIAAANHKRLIEREHLIIDRNKILPTIILDTLVIWPEPMASPLHARLYQNSEGAVRHRMEHIIAGDAGQYLALHNEVPEPLQQSAEKFFNHYAMHTENVMKDNPDKAQMIEDMIQAMGAPIDGIRRALQKGTFPHICRPLGEWLHDYEHVLEEPDLKASGRMSAYLGAGEEVLEFWRTINNLQDWKPYVRRLANDFDLPAPPRDPRKRKPEPARQPVPTWKPSAGMI